MYVADSENNRIQKFTPEGQFVSSFGDKPGQLTHPLDISFDDIDLLYICEGSPNYHISVFTTTGKFIYCVGKDTIGRPIESVIKDGYLYVCDVLNDIILIF